MGRWNHGANPPTFKLERFPVNLEELNDCGHGIAIWRENNKLTYMTPHGSNDLPIPFQKMLSVVSFNGGPMFNIAGRTDKSVVETASFFIGLEDSTTECSSLMIGTAYIDGFDFRNARFDCLPHIFEVAPSRTLELRNLKLSAAQSAVLATRPGPIELILEECTFSDEGKAFVDAAESHKSSFKTLAFVNSSPLNDDNLKRLLQLDTIERLGLPQLSDDLALLPFAAKIDHLDYDILTLSLFEPEFQTVDIVPKKLALTMLQDYKYMQTKIIDVFKRLENVGHFEELKLRFKFDDNEAGIPRFVSYTLISAVMANPNLKVLDLGTDEDDLEWDMHVQTLFDGLKDHPGLRVIKLNVCQAAFGPNYMHLRKLLARNPNIIVTNENDDIYTDGSLVDELYAMHRFFHGSAELAIQPPLERVSLVGTALVEQASNDFCRSAILLSHHADALNELVQGAVSDEH